jgi:hypothetical protein
LVWIVEFGAGSANKNNQQELINEAVSDYQQLGYGVLIYLNISDANIQGPDYRLNPSNNFGGIL